MLFKDGNRIDLSIVSKHRFQMDYHFDSLTIVWLDKDTLLTSIMDKLVERKLINRDHSGEDRRVINVSLTTDGRTAFKSLQNKKKKTAETMLSNYSEKEQTLIIKHINQLAGMIGTLE